MKHTTKTSFLALTAAFLSLSATAQATDILTPADAYSNTAAPHSWTGLWLGAVGGYQISNSKADFDYNVQDHTDGGDFDAGEIENFGGAFIDGLGAEGLFGEAQIGFDKQIGQRTVVGIFGGYNINDAEFSAGYSAVQSAGDSDNGNAQTPGCTPAADCVTSSGTLSFEQEWGGILGARVGVLKSQDTLFYVAGGWAFAELGEVKANGSTAFANQETDLSGWFGEVGMETRLRELGDNVYLTVAGRYTDYSALTLDSTSGPCAACPDPNDTLNTNLELDHNVLSAMAGLKIKLNDIGN